MEFVREVDFPDDGIALKVTSMLFIEDKIVTLSIRNVFGGSFNHLPLEMIRIYSEEKGLEKEIKMNESLNKKMVYFDNKIIVFSRQGSNHKILIFNYPEFTKFKVKPIKFHSCDKILEHWSNEKSFIGTYTWSDSMDHFSVILYGLNYEAEEFVIKSYKREFVEKYDYFDVETESVKTEIYRKEKNYYDIYSVTQSPTNDHHFAIVHGNMRTYTIEILDFKTDPPTIKYNNFPEVKMIRENASYTQIKSKFIASSTSNNDFLVTALGGREKLIPVPNFIIWNINEQNIHQKINIDHRVKTIFQENNRSVLICGTEESVIRYNLSKGLTKLHEDKKQIEIEHYKDGVETITEMGYISINRRRIATFQSIYVWSGRNEYRNTKKLKFWKLPVLYEEKDMVERIKFVFDTYFVDIKLYSKKLMIKQLGNTIFLVLPNIFI